MLRRISVYTVILSICVLAEVTNVTGETNNSFPRPSVVNFGALFTLNSVIGRSVKPAIVAAIDDVNSDSSILPGTNLNMILHDTNCSGFLGTVGGNFCIKKSQKIFFIFKLLKMLNIWTAFPIKSYWNA